MIVCLLIFATFAESARRLSAACRKRQGTEENTWLSACCKSAMKLSLFQKQITTITAFSRCSDLRPFERVCHACVSGASAISSANNEEMLRHKTLRQGGACCTRDPFLHVTSAAAAMQLPYVHVLIHPLHANQFEEQVHCSRVLTASFAARCPLLERGHGLFSYQSFPEELS